MNQLPDRENTIDWEPRSGMFELGNNNKPFLIAAFNGHQDQKECPTCPANQRNRNNKYIYGRAMLSTHVNKFDWLAFSSVCLQKL